MDFNSGQTLYEKNSDEVMTPSSMTKIMTAYIVFEKLESGVLQLKDKFPVTNNATSKGGSTMFLKSGQEVSVDDLLKGVIILSGNDASIALAEGLYGSEEAFVKQMNIKAQELGLKDTVFKNCTGWPDEGHLMTAKDLALLAQHLIKKFPHYYHAS